MLTAYAMGLMIAAPLGALILLACHAVDLYLAGSARRERARRHRARLARR